MIRNKKYQLTREEQREIAERCKKLDLLEQDLLLQAAREANVGIADDLYYSLRRGLSYEELGKRGCTFINKGDFYAYRRKAINIFYAALILNGNTP